MRRAFFCLLLCFLLVFGACAPHGEDWFAAVSGDLTAELAGTLHGAEFAATLTLFARNEAGVREATLTFYAPEALCGTVVKRDGTGVLFIGAEGLLIPSEAASGFLPLLELFPDGGTVQEVAMEGELCRITGEGFTLLLHADGTPAACSNEAVYAEVKSFQVESNG